MGRKVIDLIGRRFGRLVVIERMENNKWGELMWKCKCDCGNIITARGGHLKDNNITSCGCYRLEINTIHGDTNNPKSPYVAWSHLKERCNCPTCPAYKFYGKKNIKVCEEWNDYANFKKWALANGWKKGLTIDRIDSNGNYEPNNCRWIPNRDNSCKNPDRIPDSKYIGVSKNGDNWRARLCKHNKVYHIGTFNTEEEAYQARNDYIRMITPSPENIIAASGF